MNLSRMMIDRMFIERHDGSRTGPFKTRFGGDTLLVFLDALEIGEGDRIIQLMRDGCELAHLVEGVSFNPPRGKIAAHFSIRILPSSEALAPREHATADGAARPAAVQSIAEALDSLERAIASTAFSVQEKNAAIGLLQALRDNDVVDFVLKRAN